MKRIREAAVGVMLFAFVMVGVGLQRVQESQHVNDVIVEKAIITRKVEKTVEKETKKPLEIAQTADRRCETEGEYTTGKWVYDPSREAKYQSYDGISGKIPGCCGRYAKATGTKRQAPLYKWVPSTCRIDDFSEERFCRSLQNRSIIFIGDSINELWHFSILQELGIRKDFSAVEGTAGGKSKCPKHPICGKYYKKPLMLRHITNQFLAMTSMRRVNRKWWKYVLEFDIAVVNSGAWMVQPEEAKSGRNIPVSDSKYAAFMTQATNYLQKEFKGTVIFRTTHPGHPHCESAEGPLTEPIPRPYPQKYSSFRWEAVFERNEVAKKLFKGIGAQILDIEPMTTLRPDGHLGHSHPVNWIIKHGEKPTPTFNQTSKMASDCLHYCIPGPMDTWSQLLQNMLNGTIV
eukprot:TRINITY_DN21815_c0_g1_i1.p1 TRINITY_DN21815_c0_g1~~TRINITY_DN21815_c0_g1_i1.p1  ORF type:complete len:429 (+),score=49.77 TRINITY_DN21815_c0_g1_i1:79-1287(+)